MLSVPSRRPFWKTLVTAAAFLVAFGGLAAPTPSSAASHAPAGTAWSTTGSLPQALNSQVAALLPNGKAIVAGGVQDGVYRADAFLYTTGTSAWTAAAAMPVARNRHSGVLLANGKFMVVGGVSDFGFETAATVYDPASDTWSSAGSLSLGRQDQTATLLASGKVLVAGGGSGSASNLATTELYDPSSNSWSAGPNMGTGRYRLAAARLTNGKVLVVGGSDVNNNALATAELYDPTTNAFTPTGSMAHARRYHTATLLASGQVLVVGGEDASGPLSTAELYNPGTGTWTPTGALTAARDQHTATLLPDGTVLVAGGAYGLTSAELYNPAFNNWTAVGSMSVGRYFHSATLLGTGQVLVAGGYGGGSALASAELYGAAAATFTVTPSAGPNGTISPSTPQTANQNAQITFTVTPASGYVALVGGTCGGDLVGNTYTTNPITADCTVDATFSAAPLTVTPSAGPNGTISPSTPQSVSPNGNATFSVVPDVGYTALVGGTCGGTLVGTVYTTDAVTADCTVVASFQAQSFAVTPSASANGTISPSTTQMVPAGTSVVFTLTPDPGYAPSVTGTCGGNLVGNTFTTNPVSQDCTVNAAFTLSSFTVTPTATGNGTITPSTPQTVPANTSATFTVTPDAGYTATVSGTCGGTLSGNTYTTAPITTNCTVDASFALTTHVVIPGAGANGTITPSTPQTVADGATATFVVVANPGFRSSVAGTCGGTMGLDGQTYTTNPITQNCTVIASFAPFTHTVTASAGAGGSISPSGAQSVSDGMTATYTVSPNAGYVASVGGTCGGTLTGTTYTTAPITADCTVVASFAQTSHTVSPSAGPGGSISPQTPVVVADGASTTFTVLPNSGFTPSVGGTCGGTLTGHTYTTNPITADCTVVASFTGATYVVTPSVYLGGFSPPGPPHGTITPDTPQTVAAGATVAFTLTPDPGYVGTVQSTCGGMLAGNVYTTNPISANCEVVAHFDEGGGGSIVVTPSAGANGTITPSTPQTVQAGSVLTFTVTPDSGFYATVSGTCGGTLSGNTYTTLPIAQSCTVTAAFTELSDTFTVVATASLHGSITPSGNREIEAGVQVPFVVVADTGYHASVGGTCGGSFDGHVYTTSPITQDCTVTATFEADSTQTFLVNASSGQNGTISPSGVQVVPAGAVVSYTVNPLPGFTAATGGTCGGTLVGTHYVTHIIVTNCTVTFDFIPIDYTHTVNLNQHGIAGPWASAGADNQGLVIDVYPDLRGPGEGALFAGWFTFDVNPAGGHRWYTLQGDIHEGQAAAVLPIYSTVGGTFGGLDPTTTVQVGTSLLLLTDCNTGVLAFAFNDGRSGIIPLSRLVDNITCGQAGDNGAPGSNYLNSGAMADRSAEGQGFVFDFNPSRQILFAGWYTFAPAADVSPPAQDASGQRWFTIQTPFTPGISSLDNVGIYESDGGAFNRYGPATIHQVGTATITLDGCDGIRVDYTFTDGEFRGQMGTLNNRRIAPAPLGCQAPGGHPSP